MFSFSGFGISGILPSAKLQHRKILEEKKEAPCWSKALSRVVGKLKSIR
jgi:hypothetical protein